MNTIFIVGSSSGKCLFCLINMSLREAVIVKFKFIATSEAGLGAGLLDKNKIISYNYL